MTDPDLFFNQAGSSAPGTLRPGSDWEPHTGALALDRDRLEGVGEARFFNIAVHEVGHVLGAWRGYVSERHYMDADAGTWTGPNVVKLYDGPAPFQDADDYSWHDEEHNATGQRFDFVHSGVCASVMGYCTFGAAIPAFLPAEIDFAFLADIGLSILPRTDRPPRPTGSRAGWITRHSPCRYPASSMYRLPIHNRATSAMACHGRA